MARHSLLCCFCWRSNEIQGLSRPKKQAVRQPATFRGSSNHYVLDPMFHDQWKKEKNECRIYPPSQFPWNRHSKVHGIFVFKQLQKFFFCYGKLTISSLLRYSSLFHKEPTTVVRVVTGPLKGCRRRYCLKAIVRVRTIVLLFLGLGLGLKC